MSTQTTVKMSPMPQLEGLRAICLLSIILHHWTIGFFPVSIPFEMGAFVFFSLSGYLITRILIRGREKWLKGATTFQHFIKSFTVRRMLRLLPGYGLALVLYVLLLTPDVLKNFLWYATNNSNIHFARLGYWPGGADQFWTLAVDQQFYLVWPFLIFLTPRKLLPAVLILVAFISPASRWMAYQDTFFFTGAMHDKLPWFLTDHLCFGGFLAYLQERGWSLKVKGLWCCLISAFVAYLIFRYQPGGLVLPQNILIFQQTLLALFSTCVVGLCAVGGATGIGRVVLEHPLAQYIGQRSYGYYLYHNLAMLLLGKCAFFLFPPTGQPDHLLGVRILCGGALLAGLTHLSWKYLEEPLLRKKSKYSYQRCKG